MSGIETSGSVKLFRDLHLFLVEDDQVMQKMLLTVAGALGVGKVTVAGDGAECMRIIAQAGMPDLFILDVRMPNMDGFETCKAIRSSRGGGNVPIIFGSAVDQPRERYRCFECGATDLIQKPFFIPELQARLKVHLDRISMTRSLRSFRERMDDALRAAEAMQRALIRADADNELDVQGLEFDCIYEPSELIGGDLWSVEPLEDGRVFVSLIDLSGHGLIAAINAFRVHDMMAGLKGLRSNPGEWLAALNAAMAREFRSRVFATGLSGLVDTVGDTFIYASAGSPPPMLGRRGEHRGWEVKPLPSAGMMLGMMPTANYEVQEVQFDRDQFLFLYSDGVLRTSQGQELEDDELTSALSACLDESARDPLMSIWAGLPGLVEHQDDVVMLWFAREIRRD